VLRLTYFVLGSCGRRTDRLRAPFLRVVPCRCSRYPLAARPVCFCAWHRWDTTSVPAQVCILSLTGVSRTLVTPEKFRGITVRTSGEKIVTRYSPTPFEYKLYVSIQTGTELFAVENFTRETDRTRRAHGFGSSGSLAGRSPNGLTVGDESPEKRQNNDRNSPNGHGNRFAQNTPRGSCGFRE
jgi:hypothetical protein